MKISGRKLSLMRCHLDPMIATKPRLAYMFSDPDLVALKAQAKINDEGNGVCVLVDRKGNPELHFVGLPNIQAARIELTPEDIKALKENFSFESLEPPAISMEPGTIVERPTPKKLGRPKQSEAV